MRVQTDDALRVETEGSADRLRETLRTQTIGVGTMVRKAGKWMMQNQMSTGSPSLQIGHWAYMVQTKPNTASWYSLPGVGVSVPDFMEAYLDAAPTAPPP